MRLTPRVNRSTQAGKDLRPGLRLGGKRSGAGYQALRPAPVSPAVCPGSRAALAARSSSVLAHRDRAEADRISAANDHRLPIGMDRPTSSRNRSDAGTRQSRAGDAAEQRVPSAAERDEECSPAQSLACLDRVEIIRDCQATVRGHPAISLRSLKQITQDERRFLLRTWLDRHVGA